MYVIKLVADFLYKIDIRAESKGSRKKSKWSTGRTTKEKELF